MLEKIKNGDLNLEVQWVQSIISFQIVVHTVCQVYFVTDILMFVFHFSGQLWLNRQQEHNGWSKTDESRGKNSSR